jgi:putative transposase
MSLLRSLFRLKTGGLDGEQYSQIYIQAVFAVQERACLIQPEGKEDLFKYIGGIFKNQNQKLIAIGGVADHVHLLFGIKPNAAAVSDLIGEVKASSSKFVNEQRFVRGRFYWQEGFGAFSYSRSQIDAVAKYVLNQEQHHRKMSFRREYVGMLDRFEVEYEDRYLFNWIE